MEEGNMRSEINIALTKGRIEKAAIDIFESIGFDCTELREKGRKLILRDRKNGINFILAKAADVLTYVDHGAVDIGIVGKDTLMEYSKDYYEVLDLNFGKCKLCVAGLPDSKLFEGYFHKKIATKYPKSAEDYFREKSMDVEIIKIDGSVELAPILKLADAIVDIVETGTTLKENGLVILDDICNISTRMIVNRVSMRMKKHRINEIISKVEDRINSKED